MSKETFSKNWIIIAGPCAAESRQQVFDSALGISQIDKGIVFRAGIWKPRTNPNSWQGSGEKAISWMVDIKKQTGLAIATEVNIPQNIEKLLSAGFDSLWVGSRNSQNYDLLKEIGTQTSSNHIPIILKRGMSEYANEWIASAGYITRNNPNVIFCERGVRGPTENTTKNILDLQTACIVQDETGLPVIIDPSHASGRRDLITRMSLATKAVGLNGLMIEVHPTPNTALSDSSQQINIPHFRQLIQELNKYSSCK